MMMPIRGRLMSQGARRRLHGFTLIELIVAIIVISTLVTVAIDRLLYYKERHEKAAMEYTLAAVKTGLQLRMAELIVTNRQGSLNELERNNPMRWLEEAAPSNYLGDYRATPATGNWYFDPGPRQLVYVPSSSSYLDTGQSGTKELRFRVAIRYETNAVTGGKAPVAVAVAPVREFRWF